MTAQARSARRSRRISYYVRMNADTHVAGDEAPEQEQYVDVAAEVFSLLADPTRIRVILALRGGELSVGELARRVGKSPTSVSRHLTKLRWGRIVSTRQEGTRVFYRLVDEHARTLVAQAIFQAEHVVDRVPLHHRAGHRSIAGDVAAAPEPVRVVPAPAGTR